MYNDLKIIMSMTPFKPWAGAVETFNKLERLNLVDDLFSLLEDIYPEGITETQLNDILWFDSEWVFEILGVNENV